MFEFGSNFVPISDAETQQLIAGFTASTLDAPQTKQQVVKYLWKANNDREIGMPKHKIGGVLMMGRGWGKFFDAKHMLINPSEPPSDVMYDFQQPEELENILDVPRSNKWRDVVQRSFLHQKVYLARSLTQLEGMTGHQVLDLNNGGEFRYLPTKRGLALVGQLEQSIPLVIENIPENELTNIFESVLNKGKPDWHIVNSELWNGLKDATQHGLSYVNTEETTDSNDKIDIEYAKRITQARRFRFISQVVAQKMCYGIKWIFVRKQSAALQELARLEQLPTERIIKRYNL